MSYHESWVEHGDGSKSSKGDQIVITNRLIRRVIEFAITQHRYDPEVKGKELKLYNLDKVILWNDAVRASHKTT